MWIYFFALWRMTHMKWIGFGKEGSSGQDEEDEENHIESSSFQKFHLSHQEIPAWEEKRGFHLSVNSLSLHEKTSLHLPVFPNRQELVERFGCWGCFRIFHSFNQKDQKFGHLWQNEECGCSSPTSGTILSYCYFCLFGYIRRICIRPRPNHQHLMVTV